MNITGAADASIHAVSPALIFGTAPLRQKDRGASKAIYVWAKYRSRKL